MKDAPIVSIVTPSYNQGEFIEETIQSVISQEGAFYIDYIIMDGGSKDASVGIIKKYDALLKEGKWPIKCRGIDYRWVSEKDGGQADAVNRGFKQAKGEILGWLNSDDTYLPGALAKAAAYLEKHKDVMMLYGEGYHVDREGKIIERYYTERFDPERLPVLCYICQPTVFLRKNVIDEVGLLDPALHYCMDYEYWIRVSRKLKVDCIGEYLANSRIYQGTKTSQRLNVLREIIKTVKKFYGFVPDNWLIAYAESLIEPYLSNRNRLGLYVRLRRLIFRFKFIQIHRDSMPFFQLFKSMRRSVRQSSL